MANKLIGVYHGSTPVSVTQAVQVTVPAGPAGQHSNLMVCSQYIYSYASSSCSTLPSSLGFTFLICLLVSWFKSDICKCESSSTIRIMKYLVFFCCPLSTAAVYQILLRREYFYRDQRQKNILQVKYLGGITFLLKDWCPPDHKERYEQCVENEILHVSKTDLMNDMELLTVSDSMCDWQTSDWRQADHCEARPAGGWHLSSLSSSSFQWQLLGPLNAIF